MPRRGGIRVPETRRVTVLTLTMQVARTSPAAALSPTGPARAAAVASYPFGLEKLGS
jgi:hypothetical protein